LLFGSDYGMISTVEPDGGQRYQAHLLPSAVGQAIGVRKWLK